VTRATLDAYYTPDEVAVSLVATLGDLRGAQCWEPHVGGGAFARALLACGAEVAVSDVDPEAPGLDTPGAPGAIGDFRASISASGLFAFPDLPEWIVGNPPFSEAEAHVRRALAVAPNVAFLLRLAFLESAQRRPLWQEFPPAEVYVLSERPSFTGGRTDSCAYGWFVWRSPHRAPTTLRWLSWRPTP